MAQDGGPGRNPLRDFGRGRTLLRLAHQHMHTIRHHHIFHQEESVLLPNSAKFLHEEISGRHPRKQRQAPITAKRYRVELALTIVALQSLRHGTPNPPALKNRGRGTLITLLHRELQK